LSAMGRPRVRPGRRADWLGARRCLHPLIFPLRATVGALTRWSSVGSMSFCRCLSRASAACCETCAALRCIRWIAAMMRADTKAFAAYLTAFDDGQTPNQLSLKPMSRTAHQVVICSSGFWACTAWPDLRISRHGRSSGAAPWRNPVRGSPRPSAPRKGGTNGTRSFGEIRSIRAARSIR
jgi:hypothetical protein